MKEKIPKAEPRKKTWLVHMYHEESREMTISQVERLLKKRGGSHSWIGDVCHVYILPKVEVNTTLRSWPRDRRSR